MFMYIEQKICMKLNHEEIIEEFKVLVPGNRRIILL